MVEIRTPVETDREPIARLLARSLNSPVEQVLSRSPNLMLEDFRCAYEDDQIVAVAAEYHFLQWFGGSALPCSGIFAVATSPEHRSSGLASAAVGQIMREAHDRGDPLTALYPAVLQPYRRLGYEIAGTFNGHRVPLAGLPKQAGELPKVEPVDLERDLEGIKACYHEYVRTHNGPIEPTVDRWWTKRVLQNPSEESFTAVVVRDGERIDGFATFRRHSDPRTLDIEFGLDCSTMVANTEPAMRALLAYFRGYRGLGQWVEWAGPPQDPTVLLIPEQELVQNFRFHWMLRLLNIRAAFESRGWPAIDAEAVFAVDDPMFPDNNGPWRLIIVQGRARVEPAAEGRTRPIPIGALSSMFSGFLRVPDAVRLGFLDADDPSVSALQAALAGPDPWSPVFF
jgi:predicted acetyltransferase